MLGTELRAYEYKIAWFQPFELFPRGEKIPQQFEIRGKPAVGFLGNSPQCPWLLALFYSGYQPGLTWNHARCGPDAFLGCGGGILSHTQLLRGYYWLCAQGSSLMVLKELYVVSEIKQISAIRQVS